MEGVQKTRSIEGSAMATLKMSPYVFWRVSEAAERYGNSIIGFSKVVANWYFLNEKAKDRLIIVSSSDIIFADQNGNPKDMKEMTAGWYTFDNGIFKQVTKKNDNPYTDSIVSNAQVADKVEWYNRVYFTIRSIYAIKNGQKHLAVDVCHYRNGLTVSDELWPHYGAHAVLAGKPEGIETKKFGDFEPVVGTTNSILYIYTGNFGSAIGANRSESMALLDEAGLRPLRYQEMRLLLMKDETLKNLLKNSCWFYLAEEGICTINITGEPTKMGNSKIDSFRVSAVVGVPKEHSEPEKLLRKPNQQI